MNTEQVLYVNFLDLVGDKTIYMLFCTVYIFIGASLAKRKWFKSGLYFRNGLHHDNYRMCEETVRGELAEDGGAKGSDPGAAQAG